MKDNESKGNEPILVLEDIVVKFDERLVLKDVNVQVYPGEFIGLIGANGAGKSTLLKVILGLLQPTKGKVNVLGNKVEKAKNLIGYVPQKIFLDPNIPLRGRDLVALGLDGHKFGIPLLNKKRKSLVNEMLEAVDALRYADSPVGKLSGGEQQRLLIAQALLTNPKILLLDEPLSNLDIKSAYEVIDLVSRIGRERGVAVILVAHDMNPLLGAMNKVLYLADGNAVMGQVQEVFRNDVLSNLYGYPVEVLHVKGRIMVVGGQDLKTNNYSLNDSEVIS
jgi:zinc/manganese transport system ATP-binding protein